MATHEDKKKVQAKIDKLVAAGESLDRIRSFIAGCWNNHKLSNFDECDAMYAYAKAEIEKRGAVDVETEKAESDKA